MPKQSFELKQFRGGIWSTPSQRDIPTTAAAYSLDVEQLNADGKIVGRLEDIFFTTAVGFTISGVPEWAEYEEGQEVVVV